MVAGWTTGRFVAALTRHKHIQLHTTGPSCASMVTTLAKHWQGIRAVRKSGAAVQSVHACACVLVWSGVLMRYSDHKPEADASVNGKLVSGGGEVPT